MNIAPSLFTEYLARQELGFIETKCRECVARAEEAWTTMCNAYPRLRKACRARGRNALFNELVADFAREILGSAADVEICEQYGSVRLHVKERFDLGFKKVDRNGRTSNYPTTRQKRISNQMPLFGEPMPEAIRVTIGYQWNEAATEIVDVYLVYPVQKTVLFKYPLAHETVASPDIVNIPLPTQPPATKARFRSKIVKDGDVKKRKVD